MSARVLLGATLAGLCLTLGLGSVVDTQLHRVAMDQAVARANDEVALGLLGQLGQEDFQPPFEVERLDRIRRRLEPALSSLSQPQSGILRVNVITHDGTVIYSDVPGLRGASLPTEDNTHLSAALAGSTSAHRSALGSAENRDLRSQYESAIEVYVPVRIGDRVVGAYEIYEDAGFLRSTQPLVWGALVAVWLVSVAGATLTHRFGLRRRRRSGALNGPILVDGSQSAIHLTPRELEVLRLMADHTTREIGRELVLSEDTVRTHVKSILKKLNQPSRTLAILAAVRSGLLTITPTEAQLSGERKRERG